MAVNLVATGLPILALFLFSTFVTDNGVQPDCPTMCVSCGCGSPKRASFPGGKRAVENGQSLPSYGHRIPGNQRPQYFLKGVDVVYTDEEIDQPSISLGGKYVWLAPQWTTNKDDGLTSIELVVQGKDNPVYKNVCYGANGGYCYLKLVHDPSSKERIVRTGLLRLQSSLQDAKDQGWDKCTKKDITQGRSGIYLYICWNVVKIG